MNIRSAILITFLSIISHTKLANASGSARGPEALSSRAAQFRRTLSWDNQLFKGNGQGFSSFNLSLAMDATIAKPLNDDADYSDKDPFTFSLANNGNQLFQDIQSLVFPMKGTIYFHLTDANGQLVHFVGPSGQDLTFGMDSNKTYWAESEESFEQRLTNQHVLCEKKINPLYCQPMKRMLGIVTGGALMTVLFDIDHWHGDFFEMSEGTEGSTEVINLQPAGSFDLLPASPR